jgi:2-octaprenyl-6-methoxyphenol hydroxylase
MQHSKVNLGIVGAGPVGLSLALHAAHALPHASISVFDARPLDRDISHDPRTLALSLGSVQLLERLGAWPSGAQPILEVHVSELAPSGAPWMADAAVRIRAADEGVAMLGAVLRYGQIVAPLQQLWIEATQREPHRLVSRFDAAVKALKPLPDGVEIDAGIAERFDLAIVAEGGVFADQARKAVTHDYGQTAWVGSVKLAEGSPEGVAYERFTRHGPVALLPLRGGRAALVWCVASNDDPVEGLDSAQRLAVLNTLFHPEVGTVHELSPLKRFALGLNAERTLTDGRTVRIGNAAQTLHPVAGQGLNLGLRDAWELIHRLRSEPDLDDALRRLEWQRAPDRWAMIGATDFLARSFTWTLPGAGLARGMGLAALQALGPVKSALAQRMMFGSR